VGDAMTEGKVVRWYKKAGDAVKKGEPILEIETDKVNLDLEAEQDGTIGDVSASEGQVVQVGGVLAKILKEGEKSGAPVSSPAPPVQSTTTKGGGEDTAASQQRRATDKKESVKHSTGEYGEAIDMRGPRRDRTQTNVVAM